MTWRDGTSYFDVTLNGDVTFNDDLTDVQTLSDGGSLTIRDWSLAVPRTIEIRSAGGTITRTFYVAGSSRGWDDEGRRALAALLPQLVRRSGLGAEARVKSIFAKRGISGVLDEIALLGSDYVRRLYYTGLIDLASFDSRSVEPVLRQVDERVTSNYDRRLILERIAKRVRLEGASTTAYLRAVAATRSDYDRRLELSALFSGAGQVSDADALANAITQIKSSYDRRLVITELMGRPSVSGAIKQLMLRATAAMPSDYDRGLVLSAYIEKFGVESAVREPFFAAVGGIKSGYERRRVLTALAHRAAAPADVQRAAFEVVGSTTSDYDRAEMLLAFVNQPMDQATRQAFVAAAERIRSSHDQNRVLAALVKSERR